MDDQMVRPTKEELELLLSTCYMEQVARKFGVSSNAVRKWIKKFGISIKAQKHKGFKRNQSSIEKGRTALKKHYEKYDSPLGKTIVQLSKENEIINFFPSISAVRKQWYNDRMVAKVIQGKLKTYLGFFWKECIVVKESDNVASIRSKNKDCVLVYRCVTCGQVFTSKLKRRKHREEKKHYVHSHQWQCPFCDKIVPTRRYLQQHIREEHITDRRYKCKYCGEEFENINTLGAHTLHCSKNPNYEKNLSIIKASLRKHHPKHLSDETKNRISISMKRFLSEHPESASYKREHYSKGSWAEDYFIKLFSSEGIKGYVPQYRIGRYRLDFAFPATKVDFEVDGHQHRVDKRIVEHDKERTENLMKLGWKTIRLDWGYYQSLSQEEKRNWLQRNLYPFIETYSKQYQNTSKDCPLE